MKFLCFSSNEIRLPSSFSVIHMSVNIKNNVERRDFVVVVVFFSHQKFGRHAIFLRYIWVAIPVDRAVYVHVITTFSRMGGFT